ncbi:hypothetical protein LCGC14_1390520 [marine sediment metagenome]|uniref:Uncharacterized protein n=1 Tax=marine sediment metagenome TaxID=412755 RepID=A0A0F9K044_9ZZZZ|nr:hypothetical protein [archaeon]
MQVQIGKMILYGILAAVSYLIGPLIVFQLLDTYNIMTFSQAFKLSIIIFGIIGIAFSMLRHLFPKDTSANRLVAFGATVYSGIYMFYMFGGFTVGVSYGTYAIDIPKLGIQVLLGLQLIAWTLLASSGIRAVQYLVEAIEISKQKEYNVSVRRKFKLSKVFKVVGSILGLVIAGYFISLVYSGLNLGFDIHDTYGRSYDDGGTPPPTLSDDTLNLTMTFEVSNQGFFAIYGVSIDVRFFTHNSTNTTALPNGIKVGESLNNNFPTFHAFTLTPENNVTVAIDPAYIEGFITTPTKLEFRISFSTLYAGIRVKLNISIENVDWPGIP